MNIKLSPDFFFLHGKFLVENCNMANLAKAAENGQVQNFLNDLLKARALLKRFLSNAEGNKRASGKLWQAGNFLKHFLTKVDKISASYNTTQELLSACESKIDAIIPAAKQFEERAGETLLIRLAACYTELVNAIVGAEEYASSTRIQLDSYYSEVASSLLTAGADVNAKDYANRTPLHFAVETSQVEVVKALLAAGADTEVKDCGDYTPLHKAAEQDQVEIVEVLLAAGIDGGRLLREAAEQGQVEVVKALLAAGADVNAKGKYSATPLHWTNHPEVVEFLLDFGANVHAKNKDGMIPLNIVINREVAEILHDAMEKTKRK